jgi:hypothetical protein
LAGVTLRGAFQKLFLMRNAGTRFPRSRAAPVATASRLGSLTFATNALAQKNITARHSFESAVFTNPIVRRSRVAHDRDSVLRRGGEFDVRMASYGVQAVEEFGQLLDQMLKAALVIKQTSTIEPPLNKSDLAEFFERVPSIFPPTSSPESKKHVIETAARDAFNNLLVS